MTSANRPAKQHRTFVCSHRRPHRCRSGRRGQLLSAIWPRKPTVRKYLAANSRQTRLTVEHMEHFTSGERDISLGAPGKTNKQKVNSRLGKSRWVDRAWTCTALLTSLLWLDKVKSERLKKERKQRVGKLKSCQSVRTHSGALQCRVT